MPKENYSKNLLIDLKIEKSFVENVFVDSQENFYVLHACNSENTLFRIEIFNKTGKMIRKIDWNNPYPKLSFNILVDEDGNILLFSESTYGARAFILDKNGRLLGTFMVQEVMRKYGFSNGIVYQYTNGKVLYKLPNAKSAPQQKMYFKDFDETADLDKGRLEANNFKYHPKSFIHLPRKLGDFYGSWPIAVTYDNTSYAVYTTNPVYNKPGYSFQNPFQLSELVKFDSKYRIIGVMNVENVYPLLINPETGNLYCFESQYKDGILKIYRWDKIN